MFFHPCNLVPHFPPVKLIVDGFLPEKLFHLGTLLLLLDASINHALDLLVLLKILDLLVLATPATYGWFSGERSQNLWI